jgi:hypothetical protein
MGKISSLSGLDKIRLAFGPRRESPALNQTIACVSTTYLLGIFKLRFTSPLSQTEIIIVSLRLPGELTEGHYSGVRRTV